MRGPNVRIRLALRAWTVSGVLVSAATASGQTGGYQGPCALVASRDAKTLYVACADARQVAWVDLPTGKITRRVEMPDGPTGLVLSPDGTKLIVTCAAPKSTVAIIDLVSCRMIAAIPAGHTATGAAITPDGKRLYVCNRFNNDVAVIDLAAGREVTRVGVAREPVAAAATPDGTAVLVANHLPVGTPSAYPFAAVVTLLDTRTNQTTAMALPHGSHSLRGLCVAPDGKHAYVTHLVSNFDLIPLQVEQGWMSSNVVSVIDTRQKRVIRTVGLDEPSLGAGNPWAVACAGDGKTICVSHAGTHELSVVATAAILGPLVHVVTAPAVDNVPDDPAQRPGLRRIKLPGQGPRALAVAGSRVFVAEYFSDSLAVVDLQAGKILSAETIVLGPEPRLTVGRRGEMLFNDATICYQHWQSCASCHPDGRSDALNWDLLNDGVGNPKNTKSMVLAHKTPPAMAEGVRPTAESAVRSGLTHILFADRPEEEAAAIDEYLKLLQPVPSPHLIDGRLSPAAERGKKLFLSDRIGCHHCHPAPLYTDLKMHKVDTRGPADYVDAFDTPALVEVWRTAPYLHDGRYATIKELIGKGKHGKDRDHPREISESEVDDLVAFVLSL
jgi:YVTN family beta-propeller protein